MTTPTVPARPAIYVRVAAARTQHPSKSHDWAP
jgi:hypothetical protein